MSNWSKQQETKKEVAQLTFAGLVLGGITPLYANVDTGINWYVLIAGSIWTIMLAKVGNTILK